MGSSAAHTSNLSRQMSKEVQIVENKVFVYFKGSCHNKLLKLKKKDIWAFWGRIGA